MEVQKAIDLLLPASHRFIKMGSWADLGCGSGLFTTALAGLLPPGSVVYAVDANRQALKRLQPIEGITLKKITADFMEDPLPLSGLDGILMANALHFVYDKAAFLHMSRQWLHEEGCFLLVEYDTETPDPWLPYPLSFKAATNLFARSGYKIRKLGSQPSVFKRSGMYAALLER